MVQKQSILGNTSQQWQRPMWVDSFLHAAMAERNDDVLLDDVSTTSWDQLEWEW